MLTKYREIGVEVLPTYGIWTVFVDGRPVGRYFEKDDADQLAEDYKNNNTVIPVDTASRDKLYFSTGVNHTEEC